VILGWAQAKPGRRVEFDLRAVLIFVFLVLISVARGYALRRLDLRVAASCSGFIGSREQGFIFPPVILLPARLASGFGLVSAQVRDLLGAGSVFHSRFPVRSRAFVDATPASHRISVPAAARDLLPTLFPIRSVSAAVPPTDRVSCSRTRMALGLLACWTSL
jgi:hypothetical protein